MPAPLLEIAVGSMTAVLLLREVRAILKDQKMNRNGNTPAAAIVKLTEALTAKELKDSERFGNVVGHIKDSERRLAERISESRK